MKSGSFEIILLFLSIFAGVAAVNSPDKYRSPNQQSAYPSPYPTPYPSQTIIVTNTNNGGTGSLRQAIADANINGWDKITFASYLAGETIHLQSTLTIDKNITIDASSLTEKIVLNGDSDNDNDGDILILNILANQTVVIKNLEFTKGYTPNTTNAGAIANLGSLNIYDSEFNSNQGGQGGAIRNSGDLYVENSIFTNNIGVEGGAILNSINANTEIRNSTFSNNVANEVNDLGGSGGAIANVGIIFIADTEFTNNNATGGGAVINSFDGTLIISGSTFIGNSATEYGGGAVNNFEGTLEIYQSTFSNNSAYSGGAISTGKVGEEYYATTTISESVITNNEAIFLGGGIDFASGVSMTIDKTTISQNTAEAGGGINNITYGGLLLITNSLISNNISTEPQAPGGIFSFLSPLTIKNSTITGNSNAGIGQQGITIINNSTIADNEGNGLEIHNYSLNLTNSILANNGSYDCFNSSSTVTNQNNLIETNSGCGTPAFTADPLLGPLADNGGFTQTMFLYGTSPAFNAGNNATCESTDQRGVTRPQNGVCDLGAFEADLYVPYLPTLTPTASRTPTLTATSVFTSTPTPTFTRTPTVSRTPTASGTPTITMTPTNTPLPSCSNIFINRTRFNGDNFEARVINNNLASAYLINATLIWSPSPLTGGKYFDFAQFGTTYYDPVETSINNSPLNITSSVSDNLSISGNGTQVSWIADFSNLTWEGLWSISLTFNFPGWGDCTINSSVANFTATPTQTTTFTSTPTATATFTPTTTYTATSTNTRTPTATASFTPTSTSSATPTDTSSALDPNRIIFQEVVNGLSNPVFITHAGDNSNRLFILERSGKIRIVKNGTLLTTPFLDIQSIVKSTSGEQGLLGLAFHPSYESNGKFYVIYTAPRSGDTNGSVLTLRQYTVSTNNPDLANSSSGTTILTIDHPTYNNHNGGTIAFGNDGYLYWSTGDGGGSGDPNNNGQNLTSLLGKILRIDVNSGSPYSIPPTNPFYNNTNANTKLIWSYGLRNPWRISFDRQTYDLYIGDVGQANREEINFQSSNSIGGENYGWRIMEGSLCYNPSSGCDQNGKIIPVAEYNHSLGCSVTGGYVYRGSSFPSLSGHYFYGDYCSGRIFSTYKNISSWSTPTQLADTTYNISTFGEDESGELYFADYSIGKIYKIKYQEPAYSTNIGVTIGTTLMGSYHLSPSESKRVNYAGVDSGPVVVEATDNTDIIAALRDAYFVGGQLESFVQLMGLPQESLSTTYYFPAYNNVTLDGQLRFGNVGNNPTTVTVTIAGVLRGTYPLNPGEAKRVNYLGLDTGPVVVQSSGEPIIAALRDAYFVDGKLESFAQLMGLPAEKLSTKYYFPAYNNVTLDGQLRFGNVGDDPTTVTVTIAGILRGTYNLNPSQAVRVNYPLDAGPVVVESSGEPITAALRDAYFVDGKLVSFVQLMGLPQEQLSTKYNFPAYNNVTLDGQLRFGNVGNAPTTVTVTIAGIERGTYNLNPSQALRVNYVGLDTGPIVVESSAAIPIIAALRDAYFVNGKVESFAQLMGLPQELLSSAYFFPAYNNVTLDGQLRFGVP